MVSPRLLPVPRLFVVCCFCDFDFGGGGVRITVIWCLQSYSLVAAWEMGDPTNISFGGLAPCDPPFQVLMHSLFQGSRSSGWQRSDTSRPGVWADAPFEHGRGGRAQIGSDHSLVGTLLCKVILTAVSLLSNL